MEIVPDLVIPPLPSAIRGEGLHIGGTLVKGKRLLYSNDTLVIQRNLDNINESRINAEHAVAVKTAKFSPNGEWICSGDTSGQVFVWAHKSFVVKNTISVGKQCLEVAWSSDGQRIVAVGKGKDEKGKVFPWNTNNKLGELGGAQKGFLCCDFKPNRPFRVITGSEDYGVYLYKGPPFKFEAASHDHTNYVNAVKYSPDGSKYISVSSDKKIIAFDGQTGAKLKVICDGKAATIKSNDHHKGTIYELSWNKDGTQFITSSADKTCKVWDYESGGVIHTFTFADKPSVADMQVSCLWLDQYLISISLSGKINYLDPALKEQRPVKVLTGHKKSIVDMDYDAKHNVVFTGDNDCRVVRTECKTGECTDVVGEPHKSPQLVYVRTSCDNSSLYTIAVNDTLCKSEICDTDDEKGNVLGDKTIKLDGAPRGCCVGNVNAKLVIIPTHRNKILFISDFDTNKISEVSTKYTPTSCALSSDDKLLVVGSGRDGDTSIYFYDVDDQKELSKMTINNKQYIRADIIAVAISADSKFIASAHKDMNIWIWDLDKIRNGDSEKPVNFNKGMKYHSGLISSIEFSPDSKQLLSCSHDSNIYLFTNPTEGKNVNIHLDHAFSGMVKKCQFIDQNRIVAVGADSTIRFFNINKK